MQARGCRCGLLARATERAAHEKRYDARAKRIRAAEKKRPRARERSYNRASKRALQVNERASERAAHKLKRNDARQK